MSSPPRTAVILFNLGGPDQPQAVEPFLYNLFSDPAIIRLPGGLRQALAWLIARRRAPIAREIYAQIGGGSPILGNTEAQAQALDRALGEGFKSFIAMRYWHPRADEAARAVKTWGPDRIVLLPLYPQYSSTTSGSSLREWAVAARRAGLDRPTSSVCCWPEDEGFVAEVVSAVARELEAAGPGAQRVLFSAHGLPKRVVVAGDPYQSQVERTVAAVLQRLPADTDSAICYQSRVGPLEWIGPATEAEIRRAGSDGVGLIVVPIAFVSEHSETLVELDIEYRHLAEEVGVPSYRRVGTVDAGTAFIEGLAGLVRSAAGRIGVAAGREGRCGRDWRLCPCATEGAV